MWGAELKYLTNEKESQLFFTPKAGISMLGGASLCYGYNTPTRKNKLEEIPDAIEKLYSDLVNHFIAEEMKKWRQENETS